MIAEGGSIPDLEVFPAEKHFCHSKSFAGSACGDSAMIAEPIIDKVGMLFMCFSGLMLED